MFSPQLSGMFVIIPRMAYPELKLTKSKKNQARGIKPGLIKVFAKHFGEEVLAV